MILYPIYKADIMKLRNTFEQESNHSKSHTNQISTISLPIDGCSRAGTLAKALDIGVQ